MRIPLNYNKSNIEKAIYIIEQVKEDLKNIGVTAYTHKKLHHVEHNDKSESAYFQMSLSINEMLLKTYSVVEEPK